MGLDPCSISKKAKKCLQGLNIQVSAEAHSIWVGSHLWHDAVQGIERIWKFFGEALRLTLKYLIFWKQQLNGLLRMLHVPVSESPVLQDLPGG